MPALIINYTTEAERLAYERAIAFVAEIHQLGLEAPARDVIDACEGFALDQGRKLLQETLAGAVQARVDDLDQKKKAPQPLARGTIEAGTKGDGNAPS